MLKFYIKNMVCGRCKLIVKTEFEKLGLTPIAVELGEVTINETTIDSKIVELEKVLNHYGFELLSDKKSKVIEKIKNLIVDLVHNKNNELNENLSWYISKIIRQDYTNLSSLFSEVEGITIEQYYITQKIEKVKELLVYDELTLSEIAVQLNYSSVAHLSNQFKKIIGLTPSAFKNLKDKKRRQIEDI